MFTLNRPTAGCQPHRYYLLSDQTDGETYRLSHPLAQYVLSTALALPDHPAHICFDPAKAGLYVEIPEKLRHSSGWLYLEKLDVSSFEQEQHVLFTGCTKGGKWLTQEECERMFLLFGEELPARQPVSSEMIRVLTADASQHRQSALQQIDSRNMVYFKEEEDRIFRLERDVVDALERELDTVKRQIREAERGARQAATLEEKLEATRKLEALERQKRRKRNELADREDEAAEHRREII